MKNQEIERILGELNIHSLNKQLGRREFGPIPVAIGDLFACGCYFIKQGKRDLGNKLCRTALSAYGIESDLINRILDLIDGMEQEIARLLNPHLEIPDWLFNIKEK